MYEIREVPVNSKSPETKGTLIALTETYPEAMTKATELTEKGRSVYVIRSEN